MLIENRLPVWQLSLNTVAVVDNLKIAFFTVE